MHSTAHSHPHFTFLLLVKNPYKFDFAFFFLVGSRNVLLLYEVPVDADLFLPDGNSCLTMTFIGKTFVGTALAPSVEGVAAVAPLTVTLLLLLLLVVVFVLLCTPGV